MKTTGYIICTLAVALMFAATACQSKEPDRLWEEEERNVHIRINWSSDQTPPVSYGMRINLFSFDGAPDYGIDDVPYTGCTVSLPAGTTHRTLAYSYYGNNLNFRGQHNPEQVEAYGSTVSRTTYSALYPDEITVGEPTGYLYVGENARYTVLDTGEDHYIDLWPADRLYMYTFEVRNVQGVKNISSARGAIAGMANAYFIGALRRGTENHTLCFSASPDVATSRITGSFRTFGRVDATNNFTIEILYPASITSGLIQRTWDVTSQIGNETNYHIMIDGSDIDVPDEPKNPGGNEGWDISVDDWEDVVVPLC